MVKNGTNILPLARGFHILYTSKRSFSEFENNFLVKPVEIFSKIDKQIEFDLILDYSGQKTTQNMASVALYSTYF